MKKLVLGFSFLSAISFSIISHAAPITYHFSANGQGDISSANTELLELLGAEALYHPNSGTLANIGINGTFIYDNSFNTPSSPPTTVNGLPPAAYGVRYAGAASNFFGSAFGINFSATSDGQVLVYNDAPFIGGMSKRDLVIAGASDVSSFSIGVYTLERVNIYWGAANSPSNLIPALVSSTALPNSPLDLTNAGIQLIFSDGESQSAVSYAGTIEISEVPVPAALSLMFSAIAGLFGLRRLRR